MKDTLCTSLCILTLWLLRVIWIKNVLWLVSSSLPSSINALDISLMTAILLLTKYIHFPVLFTWSRDSITSHFFIFVNFICPFSNIFRCFVFVVQFDFCSSFRFQRIGIICVVSDIIGIFSETQEYNSHVMLNVMWAPILIPSQTSEFTSSNISMLMVNLDGHRMFQFIVLYGRISIRNLCRVTCQVTNGAE